MISYDHVSGLVSAFDIVSIHLYSASRSAYQSEALPIAWHRCSGIAEQLCAKNLLKVTTW